MTHTTSPARLAAPSHRAEAAPCRSRTTATRLSSERRSRGNDLQTPRLSAAVGVGDDECQRSVVEDVPADRASTLLVIEDQLSNLRGNSFSLPVSFPDAC